MRYVIPFLMAGSVAAGVSAQGAARPPAAPGPGCVAIATPLSSRIYTYQHVESTGGRTTTTEQWESVTPTGSKVRTTGPKGVIVQVNTHRIANDVAILTRSQQTDGRGGLISTTGFDPGMVSDPAFRACPDKSWNISPVTVSFRDSAGRGGSTQMPGGMLKIIAVREKVVVPAGTFDAVHYVRAVSTSTDEYWKSIDHGVVVKHLSVLGHGAGGVTETLIAIK